MFSILRIIIAGFFIGGLARFFYPGPVPMLWWQSIGIGIAGSFLGGLIAYVSDQEGSKKPFHRSGCLLSIIGACILIFIVRHFNLLG